MSKNKNPLKDLDLFLKQQAASFVSPTPLSEKIQPSTPETPKSIASEESLVESIGNLLDKNPGALYDALIEAAEQKTSAERTLLINTALYLKNTNNLSAGQAGWKEAIREYWRKQ